MLQATLPLAARLHSQAVTHRPRTYLSNHLTIVPESIPKMLPPNPKSATVRRSALDSFTLPRASRATSPDSGPGGFTNQ